MHKLVSLGMFAALIGCQSNHSIDGSQEDASLSNDKSPQIICSSTQVSDIWKLEPMLTKKGLIRAEMDVDEKEQVIKEYIRNKNAAHENCAKRSK